MRDDNVLPDSPPTPPERFRAATSDEFEGICHGAYRFAPGADTPWAADGGPTPAGVGDSE